MKLQELNLTEALVRYEKEMFTSKDRFEVAEVCEFELFSTDRNNTYCLQFNRDDKTYSITNVKWEMHDEGTADESEEFEEVYLETYPMEFYNREFLISRLVSYMQEAINEYNKKKERDELIKIIINYDQMINKNSPVSSFIENEGYEGMTELYNGLSDERLLEIKNLRRMSMSKSKK